MKVTLRQMSENQSKTLVCVWKSKSVCGTFLKPLKQWIYFNFKISEIEGLGLEQAKKCSECSKIYLFKIFQIYEIVWCVPTTLVIQKKLIFDLRGWEVKK